MVPNTHRIADLGFDHGDFLVLAARRGHMVIGVECQSVCLERFPLRHSGLPVAFRDRIELRCGDGPAALHAGDIIQTVTIAGLGEKTIANWATQLPSTVERIVACPSDMRGTIRREMRTHGYRIVDETIAQARGRLYPVIAWEKGIETRPDDAYFQVGPVLFDHHPDALETWVHHRLKRLSAAIQRWKRSDNHTDDDGLHFQRWIAALNTVQQDLVNRSHASTRNNPNKSQT